MSIYYKYFLEKHLLIEYRDDILTMDQFNANLLEVEFSKDLKNIYYYLADYRDLRIEFNSNDLKRMQKSIATFSGEINIKKWAIIYKNENDKKQIELILSTCIKNPKIDIKLFTITQEKEAYIHLGIDNISKFKK